MIFSTEDVFVFIWTSTRGTMSIEASVDFQSSKILVLKTRSDPLLMIWMVRPQQFVVTSDVLQAVLPAVWNPAVKYKRKKKERRYYSVKDCWRFVWILRERGNVCCQGWKIQTDYGGIAFLLSCVCCFLLCVLYLGHIFDT